MSPHEISTPGGSVEHYNAEAGITWMQRMTNTYPAAAWLNPVNENYWDYTLSNRMIREVMKNRMYPLTLEGLGDAMGERPDGRRVGKAGVSTWRSRWSQYNYKQKNNKTTLQH